MRFYHNSDWSKNLERVYKIEKDILFKAAHPLQIGKLKRLYIPLSLEKRTFDF